jgi:putative ABC transport system permease protein
VYGKSLFTFPWSRFISGDPEEFFSIAKLEFLSDPNSPHAASAAESDRLKKEAIAKLKKGGYIFVTPEFTRAQKVGTGDKVRVVPVNDPSRGRNFEIAAVVTSPALDIAANYFNAGGMLASQSAYVVLGTQNDLRTIFRLPNSISMFLLNFDIPETQPPAEFKLAEPALEITLPAVLNRMVETWAPALPERAAEIETIRKQIAPASAPPGSRPETTLSGRVGDRETAAVGNEANSQSAIRNPQSLRYSDLPMLNMFRAALAERVYPDWKNLTPADRWRIFREELVLRLVPRRAGAADEQHASVRALKIQIDRDLSRATMIFTAIPMVALIVAALGVGNLMMANVTSRTRQIAMLRAVGATKWQVTRLIVGEAIVLGALGSALGVALGLHAATGMTHMTEAIWGIRPAWTIPWGWVSAGIAFTVGVCLIAGIIPARHASRNNIIDALQTT